MFNEYYYTRAYKEPIYLSIITLNNAVETTLYIGNKLVRRKSLQRGYHVLSKDDVELKLQIKWFKVLPELSIGKEKVVLEKLKRKELRSRLMELNINNELNPKEKPKKPFQWKSLKTPAILIILGIIWEWTMKNMGKFWEIPSMLLFTIAYFQLFSPLLDKVPERHMDSETRGKFKFLAGVGGMILTQILLDQLN